jgi:hypothetical protein
MQFERDEKKARTNLQKHGVDFTDAEAIFASPMLQRLDTRKDYGEDRWVALGDNAGVIVYVVYTKRSDKIRLISIRSANRKERAVYEKAIINRLGPS